MEDEHDDGDGNCANGKVDIEHHLHVKWWLLVKAPPIKGPMTEETPKIILRKPWYIGRLWRGTKGIMTTMTPKKTPADPAPAITRPRMNAVDEGIAPHSTEPIWKRPMETRNTVLGLYNVYILPKNS
jgi:hypothetical protein